MDRARLRVEAHAQLAAEAVRLQGIQAEIISHIGEIPEELRDDYEHALERHDEAVGMVLRLSQPEV